MWDIHHMVNELWTLLEYAYELQLQQVMIPKCMYSTFLDNLIAHIGVVLCTNNDMMKVIILTPGNEMKSRQLPFHLIAPLQPIWNQAM